MSDKPRNCPKWAAEKIALLERRLTERTEELRQAIQNPHSRVSMEDPTRDFSEYARRYLPDNEVRFVLSNSDQDYIEVRLTREYDGGVGGLKVFGRDSLLILPEVSNGITIRLKRYLGKIA